MKATFGFLTILLLAAMAVAQPSAPVLSQVFAFWCNADYSSCPYGFDPAVTPIQLANGSLVTTTWWGGQGSSNNGGTVTSASLTGRPFDLYTFVQQGNSYPFGENPVIGFTKGTDGSLYGVTESGGAHTFGVFYKVSSNGLFRVLYNFCSLPGCPDGPESLTLGHDGNFYGVGYHVFFRLTPQGQWTQISAISQLSGTNRPMILASDGNFYGASGRILFRITPSGQFRLLHQFNYPFEITSNLVEASDGYIYGGTNGSGPGTGIFRMSLTGQLTFIHAMSDSEGYEPVNVLQASDGNLWGLSSFRDGSFWSISLSGVSLQSGPFSCALTGCGPIGMIEGRDHNFYGVAGAGGNAPGKNAMGTIFRLSAGLN